MLTVDFERLGVRDGVRLLDMGCGGGRHAYEAWRRGATVVALDLDEQELKGVGYVVGQMLDDGELPTEPSVGRPGRAPSPSPSPTPRSTP